FQVEGMATAIPFHRAVVKDPAFAPELTGSSDASAPADTGSVPATAGGREAYASQESRGGER
ncbi:hypothetical protein ABZ896_47900, partial [Streptomyces sp. NPDC047072]|uniref:hypothetical protein n=1 Tax=Streptomyces sp. NPDC047072 TaxID=3154809 RepID=UPI0033D43EA2